MNDIIGPAAAIAVALVTAWFGFRSSKRAADATIRVAQEQFLAQARSERERVDAEAYNRARAIYEAGIAQLEKQLERMREILSDTQVGYDKLNADNHALHLQTSALRRQVDELERTVSEMRGRLVKAGIEVLLPPGGPRPA